jgi:hypothetical protein
MLASYVKSRAAAFLFTILLAIVLGAHAQSGSSTSITRTVVDPSGAVVTNATVEVRNPVRAFLEMQSLMPLENSSSQTFHSILIT